MDYWETNGAEDRDEKRRCGHARTSTTEGKPMLPEYARSSRLDYQERDQRVRLK
jgi:hypothetical protein